MKTVSLRMAVTLDRKLAAAAKRRDVSKSDLIREAVESFLSSRDATRAGSCLDLAGDLIGSLEGPDDLSFNKRHMRGFGQ